MIASLKNRFRILKLKNKGATIRGTIKSFDRFFEGYASGLHCGNSSWIEKGSRLLIANPDAELHIGDYFYLNSYSIIDCHYSISIGSRVQIGPLCYIGDFDHDLKVDLSKPFHRMDKTYAPVIIENNVWIGAGVKILKGVTIGENTVVAAGSVVTKNIPPNVICAGVPAVVVKQL